MNKKEYNKFRDNVKNCFGRLARKREINSKNSKIFIKEFLLTIIEALMILFVIMVGMIYVIMLIVIFPIQLVSYFINKKRFGNTHPYKLISNTLGKGLDKFISITKKLMNRKRNFDMDHKKNHKSKIKNDIKIEKVESGKGNKQTINIVS